MSNRGQGFRGRGGGGWKRGWRGRGGGGGGGWRNQGGRGRGGVSNMSMSSSTLGVSSSSSIFNNSQECKILIDKKPRLSTKFFCICLICLYFNWN